MKVHFRCGHIMMAAALFSQVDGGTHLYDSFKRALDIRKRHITALLRLLMIVDT